MMEHIAWKIAVRFVDIGRPRYLHYALIGTRLKELLIIKKAAVVTSASSLNNGEITESITCALGRDELT